MNLKSLIYFDSSEERVARELSKRLSLDCIDGSSASTSAKVRQKFIRMQVIDRRDDFALVLEKDGLTLHAIDLQGNDLSIRADFYGATPTYRRKQGGGKGQMIARAVGAKGGACLHVLDATAGLGKDAFVLASLGCRVALLEREPIIYALLEDGIRRARQFGFSEDSNLLEILDRMKLILMDARDYMSQGLMEERPDVIYLDPMFPPRTKSAQVKKEMQVFHRLLGSDNTADALLESALGFARRRVVVKRPRLSSALSVFGPSYTLEGKRNRYDVYVI